jgi:hypothetical protein
LKDKIKLIEKWGYDLKDHAPVKFVHKKLRVRNPTVASEVITEAKSDMCGRCTTVHPGFKCSTCRNCGEDLSNSKGFHYCPKRLCNSCSEPVWTVDKVVHTCTSKSGDKSKSKIVPVRVPSKKRKEALIPSSPIRKVKDVTHSVFKVLINKIPLGNCTYLNNKFIVPAHFFDGGKIKDSDVISLSSNYVDSFDLDSKSAILYERDVNMDINHSDNYYLCKPKPGAIEAMSKDRRPVTLTSVVSVVLDNSPLTMFSYDTVSTLSFVTSSGNSLKSSHRSHSCSSKPGFCGSPLMTVDGLVAGIHVAGFPNEKPELTINYYDFICSTKMSKKFRAGK